MRDGANSVHEFHARGSRCFLRLTKDRHRNRDQLLAELDFVDFLASRGLDVSCPQSSGRGKLVETLDMDDDGVWHAVVFAAASGRHFTFFSRDVDKPLFHAWGQAMGALHLASHDFVPVASRRRPIWSVQDSTSCDAGRIPAGEREARREHARVSEWLAARSATPANWGLIHGDFERTNFQLRDGSVRLYDFDDACYHWYVADIAHALWAFRNAPPDDRARFLDWFLDGYGERRPADVDVREELSWFVRLRTLSLFIVRLYDAPRASDWLKRTRVSLEAPFKW